MSKFNPIRRNNVTKTGNPDAPRTMVFVHGFGTDQTAWSDVTRAFQDDYRIVLIDNAGAGKSDEQAYEQDINRYVTLRGYAEDLVEVGNALGLRDAVVVGHSVGAMIALLACNRQPGMFSRLVLLAGSPRYLNDIGYHGGFTEEVIGDIHREMYRNYHGWTESFARAAMANPEKPQLYTYFAQYLDTIPMARAASTLITILRSDYRANLAKVSVPTLIIQSREDFAVPLEVAEYLHDHISDSRLSLIHATGHLPHVSAPNEVVVAMKNFGL